MRFSTVVAVDAMGGDNAPGELVKGAVEAINERADVKVCFYGDKEAIQKELAQYTYDAKQAEIVPTSQVIDPGESPVTAVKTKKDSSLVAGIRSVKEGKCDAVLSAGNSGALLVGGQAIVGKYKGVKRAPLGPIFPTKKGVSLLIDCGANVDARPEHLLQFAQMGSIYMEDFVGVKNPSVAIANIGEEETKGNTLVKETFPLLKACPDINFIGSIEAREIPWGEADVIVCDAFVGNVILKLMEGFADVLIGEMKSGMTSTTAGKLGGALVRGPLKATLKKFDVTEYGGTPLLGLKGLVVKIHGNASAKDVRIAVLQCCTLKEKRVNERIAKRLTGEDASS